MENQDKAYNEMMRAKRLVILFMILMIAAVISALFFYNELNESNRQLEASKLKLENANGILKAQNDTISSLKDTLLIALDSIRTLVNKGESQKVTDVIESAQKIAKDSKYEAAISLEREAFRHILNNEFEQAIELLSEAEKTYPQLHSIYEIKQYLRKNKNLFNTPEGQAELKRIIVEKYSWKAPVDLLKELKSQL